MTWPRSRKGISPTSYKARSTAPKLEVELTDYGYAYASIRPLGEEGNLVRIYHYIMPFHQLRAFQLGSGGSGAKRPLIKGHMWVPMDDENCMAYNWAYSFGDEPLTEEDRLERGSGNGPEDVMRDKNFRKRRNRDNDWLIDREVQRTETFTGIDGINTQDHAVQESMGSIVDRSEEHLVGTDKAVIAARRLLLQATSMVTAGEDPPGRSLGSYRIRAIEKILPDGVRWKDALKNEIYPSMGG